LGSKKYLRYKRDILQQLCRFTFVTTNIMSEMQFVSYVNEPLFSFLAYKLIAIARNRLCKEKDREFKASLI